jgi:hypothetical protein
VIYGCQHDERHTREIYLWPSETSTFWYNKAQQKYTCTDTLSLHRNYSRYLTLFISKTFNLHGSCSFTATICWLKYRGFFLIREKFVFIKFISQTNFWVALSTWASPACQILEARQY